MLYRKAYDKLLVWILFDLGAKSGNDYKLHSALDKIHRVESWHFQNAKVLKGNRVQFYPWYMVMFMTVDYAPNELKYKIDLSALRYFRRCFWNGIMRICE